MLPNKSVQALEQRTVVGEKDVLDSAGGSGQRIIFFKIFWDRITHAQASLRHRTFPSAGSASSITTADAIAMREEGLLMRSLGYLDKLGLANDCSINIQCSQLALT